MKNGKARSGGPGARVSVGKTGSDAAWKFLGVTTFLMLATCAMAPDRGTRAVAVFLILTLRIAPILLFVFFLFVLFNLLVSPRQVRQWMGAESGIRGWLIAGIGGVLSVGPIYAWYPLLAELRQRGLRPAFAAVFLYNRAVKLQLLPVLVHYFGGMFVAVLTFYMVLASIVSGVTVEAIGCRGPKQPDVPSAKPDNSGFPQ